MHVLLGLRRLSPGVPMTAAKMKSIILPWRWKTTLRKVEGE